MPSRIHCPACQTGFAYSPALLGKTVRCRECAHQFPVGEPPLEEPPAVLVGPNPLSPPPLPAGRRASSGPERPAGVEDRPVRREHSGSAVALIGLGAAFVVGFAVLVGGVVYLLWPDSSKPTSPVADGPPPPVEPTVIDEPPKRLEDIRRQAPVREPGGPEEAGPVVPNFRPPIAPPVVPPVDWNVPRAGRPPLLLAPDFPPVMAPAPRPAGDGPKFAPVTPLAIKPAPMDEDRKEVTLPGPTSSVTVAGGGRLLLLHVPKTKQVLVFDVSAAKVVREIGVPEADVLVAGGKNTFVIYLPAKNAIERWSCDPLERQPGGKSPFTDPVKALAMGSASNGPLVAAVAGTRQTFNGGCTLAYFDPATLKEIPYTRSGDRSGGGVGDRRTPAAIRVSADGRVVTGWGPGGPTGAESNVIEGSQVNRRWYLTAPRPLLPAADGRVLFAPGQVVASNLPPDVGRQVGPVVHYVPAAHANWYVGIQVRVGPGDVGGGAAIHIYQVGRRAAVASLDAAEVDLSRIPYGLDQSVILVPDARVLVTVAGPARDKLVLRRVNLK